mmetsp:Transcript_12843/g.27283  ORF Transcript_12843/g.27283 Transcript_12843/m.27283 type:complete len:410 (+) Transcript_12843:254-1483(+)
MVPILQWLLRNPQSNERTSLLQLPTFGGRHLLDRTQSRILRERQGNIIESIGKGADGILIDTGHGVGMLGHGDGTGDFGGASAVHDAIVFDEIAHHAHGIVEGTFGFVHDHFVPTADEDGDGIGIGTVFNDEHAFFGIPEGYLAHQSGFAQLFRTQFREARDDPPSRGNGNVFDLHTAHPSYRGQIVLQQEVVGLVIESPLTNDQIGTTILYLLHHLFEIILFLLIQLLIRLLGINVQLMLRLGLGWFERTCQNAHLGIFNGFAHLRMRNILIDHDAIHKLGILQRTTGFALHANHIKVHIASIEVGHPQHGIDRNLRHFAFVLVNNLRTQRRHGRRHQRFHVVLRKFHPIRNGIQPFDRHVRRLFVPLGDSHGMDAAREQLLGLFEQRSGEDDDAGGAVTDFVVLGGG